MPALEELLDWLGVGPNTNPEDFALIQKLHFMKKSGIMQELQQMCVVKQKMEDRIISSLQLDRANTKFKYKWNHEHNYLEITLDSPLDSPKVYGVVTFSGSNNDPHISDFTGRADSLLEIASEVAKKITTLSEAEFREQAEQYINAAKEKLKNYKPKKSKASIMSRLKKKKSQAELEKKERQDHLNFIRDTLREAAIDMAILILKAEKGADYSPLDDSEGIQLVQACCKLLHERMLEKVSETPRPHVFWANRLDDFKSEKPNADYAINIYSPVTQKSSSSRDLKNNELSNHWDAENVHLRLAENPAGKFVLESENAVKSSRSAAFVGDEKDKMPTLKAMLKRKAILQLEKMLQDDPESEIPETIDIDFLYATLLSPTIPRLPDTGKRLDYFLKALNQSDLGDKARAYLDIGNEHEILKSTRELLQALNAEGSIQLDPEDIERLQHKLELNDQQRENLKNLRVKPNCVHMNFPMNSAGETSHSYITSMTEGNLKAIKRISLVVQKDITKLMHSLDLTRVDENDIEEFIRYMPALLNTTDADNAAVDWKNAKQENFEKLIKVLKKIQSEFTPEDEEFKKLQKVINIFQHYVIIKDAVCKVGDFDENITRFTSAAAHASMLWNELDGVVHYSCKSAKDRTGLAYSAIDSVQATGTLDEEAMFNGLRYGPGSHLVSYQVTGCRFLGLQIDSDVLDEIDTKPEKRIKTLLDKKMSRKMGQLGESIFKPSTSMIRQRSSLHSAHDRTQKSPPKPPTKKTKKSPYIYSSTKRQRLTLLPSGTLTRNDDVVKSTPESKTTKWNLPQKHQEDICIKLLAEHSEYMTSTFPKSKAKEKAVYAELLKKDDYASGFSFRDEHNTLILTERPSNKNGAICEVEYGTSTNLKSAFILSLFSMNKLAEGLPNGATFTLEGITESNMSEFKEAFAAFKADCIRTKTKKNIVIAFDAESQATIDSNPSIFTKECLHDFARIGSEPNRRISMDHS